MVHEFGHAVMTLAVSGQVQRIELYANHSGVTLSAISQARSWSIIPVALAGYLTASLFAWFLFSAFARGRQHLGFLVMIGISAISLILFVRNGFGMMFLIGFIGLTVIMMAVPFKWLRDFYYLLLAFLCLEESVFGPITLVQLAWMNTRQAGDATNLALHTGVPAMVWAILFTLFALWCAKQAVQAFLGRSKRSRSMGRQTHSSSYRE